MTLNTAVVAPIPRVSERMAVIATLGFFRSSRNENRRSCSTLVNTFKLSSGYECNLWGGPPGPQPAPRPALSKFIKVARTHQADVGVGLRTWGSAPQRTHKIKPCPTPPATEHASTGTNP